MGETMKETGTIKIGYMIGLVTIYVLVRYLFDKGRSMSYVLKVIGGSDKRTMHIISRMGFFPACLKDDTSFQNGVKDMIAIFQYILLSTDKQRENLFGSGDIYEIIRAYSLDEIVRMAYEAIEKVDIA